MEERKSKRSKNKVNYNENVDEDAENSAEELNKSLSQGYKKL